MFGGRDSIGNGIGGILVVVVVMMGICCDGGIVVVVIVMTVVRVVVVISSILSNCLFCGFICGVGSGSGVNSSCCGSSFDHLLH